MTTTETPAAINWDELLPAVDAPAPISNVGAKTNVRESIHTHIRRRAEESLGKTMDAIAKAKAAGRQENTVPPQWKLQPTASLAMAEAFAKDLKKYALHRPAREEWGETPLEHYVAGSPTGQVTARAAAVVIETKDGKTTTRSVTDVDKTADPTPQFGVRYAVKPLENRKPTTANESPNGK